MGQYRATTALDVDAPLDQDRVGSPDQIERPRETFEKELDVHKARRGPVESERVAASIYTRLTEIEHDANFMNFHLRSTV